MLFVSIFLSKVLWVGFPNERVNDRMWWKMSREGPGELKLNLIHSAQTIELFQDFPFNSLMEEVVKKLPIQELSEMQVQSLGWVDLLRRAWQPTPVSLPGESQGQWSLGGYSPWGRHDWSDSARQHTNRSTTVTFTMPEPHEKFNQMMNLASPPQYSIFSKIFYDCVHQKSENWDFDGGSVIKTLCFHCRLYGFNPWLRNGNPTYRVAWTKIFFLKKPRKLFL